MVLVASMLAVAALNTLLLSSGQLVRAFTFSSSVGRKHGFDVSITTASSSQRLQMATLVTDDMTRSTPPLVELNELDTTPTLAQVRKMLPKSVFQVDTATSLLYCGIDLAAVAVSMTCLYTYIQTETYHSLPLVLQAASVFPLQLLTGFAMWCTWCIGHDAGHTTISKHPRFGPTINRIVGEITHSMVCLTPFVPWKMSHLRHHLHHNHLTRDYSHQWFVREEFGKLDDWIQWSYATRNVQLPMLYLVYLLLGIPDGGHVYFYGRLWQGSSAMQRANGAVSVAVALATALGLWNVLGTADFVVTCFVPWLVLSFWLFMVTYLQHHSSDGKLYTDDTWSFTKGAFQTVDRNYGFWTNRLSHHMMDGHVAHHLFFTRIPHYHLAQATTALQEGLEESGQSHLYKYIDTENYVQEIVRMFDQEWFFCNEEQVVRKEAGQGSMKE